MRHHPSIRYDDTMDIDADRGLNERLNGGDLDYYIDDAKDFDNTMRELELERLCVLFRGDGIEKSDEGGLKSVLLHVGNTMEPVEFKVPKKPEK